MKKILLTKGQITQVSDDKYDYLMRYKWHAQWNKPTQSYYAVRSVYIKGKSPTIILMHREIMNICDRRIKIDHKDHDTLNNQNDNLRICTHAQNQHNQKRHKHNQSGYKGVSVLHDRDKKYVASIRYDKKAIELFGEFAYINFPDGDE